MDALLRRLQSALHDRYTVEHELGRGGMAVVFLGKDLRLDRRVAIKVFERDTDLGANSERFLREIRVAAQLQHPNILPVFESGEAEGLVYYVMPYVAGASLRERLEREGPLPIGDAVRIAREVAEALDHAHRAGIVHRDIKPDNIMLADGVAVVADFGIARALESGKLTETGLAIGTPTYMSPEQATASAQVDGRSDIYALGCVLYEMLTGSPPFSGPTAQAVMARHTADQVPPLSTVRTVPAMLEAAVVKALAKLPGDRWSTSRAFADALGASGTTNPSAFDGGLRRGIRQRRVSIGIAGLVVAGTLAVVLKLRGPDAAIAAPALRTLAVLPFTVSGDTSDAVMLADGLSEGVTTGLIQVEGLGVLAGQRTTAYRGPLVDFKSVGKELGVSAVVTANLRVAGNRFRVTAQLIDVASGRAIWQRQFDGERVAAGRLQLDVFAVTDSLAGSIVDALRPTLAPAQRASLARGVRTRNAEAYTLYLQAGRVSGDLTRSSAERAVSLLRKAVRLDPDYADAWSRLAEAATEAAEFSGFPDSLVSEASVALDRALKLDPRDGMALRLRALKLFRTWQWDAALADLRAAYRIAPGSPAILGTLESLFTRINQPDSALFYSRAALPPNPTAWDWAGMAWAHGFAGQRDSALKLAERAVAIDSTIHYAHLLLMHLYLDDGRRDDAEHSLAVHRRAFGDNEYGLANLANYYLAAGDLERGKQNLRELEAMAKRQPVRFGHTAVVLLGAGQRERALAALEEAARRREDGLEINLMMSDRLAGEPRYETVSHLVFGDRKRPHMPWR